jgi:hypothetical protein
MLIEIKGYAKFVEYQLERHMKYDCINENEVNLNGKHE